MQPMKKQTTISKTKRVFKRNTCNQQLHVCVCVCCYLWLIASINDLMYGQKMQQRPATVCVCLLCVDVAQNAYGTHTHTHKHMIANIL